MHRLRPVHRLRLLRLLRLVYRPRLLRRLGPLGLPRPLSRPLGRPRILRRPACRPACRPPLVRRRQLVVARLPVVPKALPRHLLPQPRAARSL